MTTVYELFAALGIKHATARHIKIAEKHLLLMGKLDPVDLLNELGSWDLNDLENLKAFLNDRVQKI